MGLERAARSLTRAGALCVIFAGTPCMAAAQDSVMASGPLMHAMPAHSATVLAVLVGLTAFATILSLLYLRERSGWNRRELALQGALVALQGADDRAELLLNADSQVIIAWAGRGEPTIEGDPSFALDGTHLGAVAQAHSASRRILAFSTWLLQPDATVLEAEIETLCRRGTGFRRTLRTQSGRYVEAHGQAVSGRALLRLRETTGEHRALIEAKASIDAAADEILALQGLLDAIPQPVWHRDHSGALAFVNTAYVSAVEGGSREAVLRAGVELLDRSARERVAREETGLGGASQALRLSAVVAGARRILDVSESTAEGGRVGIAVDVTDLESVKADHQRQMAAHVRTLDRLPTAVAMFDQGQRLIFHNTAYQKLWGLEPAFLDGRPLDGEILDRLRVMRKLPEQADFRSWKAEVLGAYRAVEATEGPWYLPDGRTLNVIADPNPQGGLTYLFQDVSENLMLESRYSAAMKEQGETLDTLKEPVALFGADGRLRLANQAFRAVWRVNESSVQEHPRIDAVIAACRTLSPDPEPWMAIRGIVTGLSETRSGLSCRLEILDGSVLDCTAQPLPAGATLLTFIDVTASVNVERALTEKNEALERAAQLRDTFVHHVSYELRSPLTNIIGFTELLGDETVGALNARQREYADHIRGSSSALLAIINDILDLASIDAHSLALQRETVDVRSTIEAAVRGVEDRLKESNIALDLDVPGNVGSFPADAKRVRQILFNLLSNAVGFSRAGQRVKVEVRRTSDELVLKVFDQGRGIPPDVIERVFDRFESHTLGTKHRGVGLGLSIVRSFVELHGGRVSIESTLGAGTCVTCVFPLEMPEGNRNAAE
ncbi:sensor histidine kinase [Methylobacterium gnaphalii]|uniref:histidine kinase n=1 Tax=Methylobacterium gnaphalii TaxID=1010610 RepID=A0A512JH97_9HYPH|nr:PAS domain-containing sensor histidine kinase [Methylobacterium gnaphalii]GEP09232.1 two-component sensor histidine kinase [Methylobacterium gnaphalii]GJD67644.1 Sensor protein DivL [Methylobacterium gnaphalii]GLS49224.1 two-component sensor histidine kinase [Methylobacterium gnaphalii]